MAFLLKLDQFWGLIQKTDLSWNNCYDPHDIVREDQKLKVVVLKIDQDKKKVAFGLKQLYPNPWDEENGLKVGSKIEGKVKKYYELWCFRRNNARSRRTFACKRIIMEKER